MEFKQRVKDCFNKWSESDKKNSKLSLFRNLKIKITPELNLLSIRDRIYISVITIFRCNSHGLAIETGRHCENLIPK